MTEISIEPMGHYVLVEALVVEETSSTGIYLGDNSREQSACEFGKIVSSLVSDIIMPPIGKVIGGVNFSDLFVS